MLTTILPTLRESRTPEILGIEPAYRLPEAVSIDHGGHKAPLKTVEVDALGKQDSGSYGQG